MNKKREILLGILFVILTAVFYFAFTFINVILFYDVVVEYQIKFIQLGAAFLSGITVYLIANGLFGKQGKILLDWFIITAVMVACMFKFAVDWIDGGEYSLSFLLLIVSVGYLLFKKN